MRTQKHSACQADPGECRQQQRCMRRRVLQHRASGSCDGLAGPAAAVTGHSKNDANMIQQDANDTRGLKRLERLDDIAAAVSRTWLQVRLASPPVTTSGITTPFITPSPADSEMCHTSISVIELPQDLGGSDRTMPPLPAIDRNPAQRWP